MSPLPRPLHTYKKPIPVRKGWVTDGVGYIPLTRGLVAIVDADMVPTLEQHNWCATKERNGAYYAKRVPSRSTGTRRFINMARVVLGMELYSKEVFPDHINKNTLDNRCHNLRVATNADNMRNRRLQSNNSTGLKGVYFDKRNSWYYARAKYNGRYMHLGCRRTAQEAYELYCAKARELYGEFFCAG